MTQLVCIKAIDSYAVGDSISDPATIATLMGDATKAPNFVSVSAGGTVGTWPKYVTSDYTLTAQDAFTVIEVYAPSVETFITVPNDQAAAIPVGAHIEIVQLAGWSGTLTAGSGVTINGTTQTQKQYGSLLLRKRGFNKWISQVKG
jgi:hypothetical protein